MTKKIKWRNVAAIVVYLAVTIMLAACNKNKPASTVETPTTGGEAPTTAGKLNPPAWFIGEWEPEDHDPMQNITVTAHNVSVSSGNLDFSYQIRQNYMSDFKEILNGDTYTLSYKAANQSFSYTFEPYGSGKMKETLMGMTSIYIKKP